MRQAISNTMQAWIALGVFAVAGAAASVPLMLSPVPAPGAETIALATGEAPLGMADRFDAEKRAASEDELPAQF